jgi:hypothetical protein
MKVAAPVKKEEKMHYYNLQRNWTRKIVPHLKDKTLNTILVRDFNKYSLSMWNRTFNLGQLPEDIESCDWRWSSGRRGRMPRYWAYVKHGAGAYVVNFALSLALRAEPNRIWRIVTSDEYCTVWDGRKTLFDFNFQALGISANRSWQLARYGQNCEILLPGEELILDDPLPWFRDQQELPINTSVTLDEIHRRRAGFIA